MTSRVRLGVMPKRATAARPLGLRSRSVTPRSWRVRRTPNAPQAGLRLVRFMSARDYFSRGHAGIPPNFPNSSKKVSNINVGIAKVSTTRRRQSAVQLRQGKLQDPAADH
jgi:hypothetical protein